MKSFGGIGGDFDDLEFCDTAISDPATGDDAGHYPWWQSLSEGKRFYVPDVVRLKGKVIEFNVSALTALGNELVAANKPFYRTRTEFGRKSFDKVIAGQPMSYPKAVLATRTINRFLAETKVTNGRGEIIQIGRGRILMSGYRIHGLTAALGKFTQDTAGQTETESATEFLAREAEVAEYIIEALSREDTKFVVFPTALQVIRALLRNRHRFGIGGDATEQMFLKLGPHTRAPYSKLDLRLSVPETEDHDEATPGDPKFLSRTQISPNPENPYGLKIA